MAFPGLSHEGGTWQDYQDSWLRGEKLAFSADLREITTNTFELVLDSVMDQEEKAAEVKKQRTARKRRAKSAAAAGLPVAAASAAAADEMPPAAPSPQMSHSSPSPSPPVRPTRRLRRITRPKVEEDSEEEEEQEGQDSEEEEEDDDDSEKREGKGDGDGGAPSEVVSESESQEGAKKMNVDHKEGGGGAHGEGGGDEKKFDDEENRKAADERKRKADDEEGRKADDEEGKAAPEVGVEGDEQDEDPKGMRNVRGNVTAEEIAPAFSDPVENPAPSIQLEVEPASDEQSVEARKRAHKAERKKKRRDAKGIRRAASAAAAPPATAEPPATVKRVLSEPLDGARAQQKKRKVDAPRECFDSSECGPRLTINTAITPMSSLTLGTGIRSSRHSSPSSEVSSGGGRRLKSFR